MAFVKSAERSASEADSPRAAEPNDGKKCLVEAFAHLLAETALGYSASQSASTGLCEQAPRAALDARRVYRRG